MLRQLQKVYSISLRKKHHYSARLSAKECFSVNFSRTQKMKKSFTRIGVFIWNSFPHSKTFNISNFSKKIKSLLLNTLDKEDNYSNVAYLIEYFTKLTYLHCDFSLF